MPTYGINEGLRRKPVQAQQPGMAMARPVQQGASDPISRPGVVPMERQRIGGVVLNQRESIRPTLSAMSRARQQGQDPLLLSNATENLRRNAAQNNISIGSDTNTALSALSRGETTNQMEGRELAMRRTQADTDLTSAQGFLARQQGEVLVPAQAMMARGQGAGAMLEGVGQAITNPLASAYGSFQGRMGQQAGADATRFAATTKAQNDLEVAKVKGQADVEAAKFGAQQAPPRQYMDPIQDSRIQVLQNRADFFRKRVADGMASEEDIAQLAEVDSQLDQLTQGGQQPGIQNASQGAGEVTATNHQTGERMVYRNGQWVPAQ